MKVFSIEATVALAGLVALMASSGCGVSFQVADTMDSASKKDDPIQVQVEERPRVSCTLKSDGGTCDDIIDDLKTGTNPQLSRKLIDDPSWSPGDRICLKAGNYPYARLVIQGAVGTASAPIELINCDGRVVIGNSIDADADGDVDLARALEFNGVKHFKVTGTGSPDFRYGIKVAGTHTGAGVSFSGLASDMEVEFVEITKTGFSGIMAKTDPGCSDTNPTSFRGGFVQRNSTFHDNYIHDLNGGEGFYVGFSFYQGYTSNRGCPGTKLYSHPLLNTKIYRNRLERTACEAIQVGMGKDSQVHDNYILGYGMSPFANYQNNGIQVGGGTSGRFYNNYVVKAPSTTTGGHGMMIGPTGDTVISGNTFVGGGLYVHKGTGQLWDGTVDTSVTLKIINNTIINSTPAERNRGIWNANSTIQKYFLNNLILLADPLASTGMTLQQHVFIDSVLDQTVPGIDQRDGLVGPTVTVANNIKGSISEDRNRHFMNYSAMDFRLKPNSSAVDAGISVSSHGVNTSMALDHDSKLVLSKPRVVGDGTDVGAFER